MKKSVKILGTISAAALAAVAMTSCKHDSPSNDTTTAKPTETDKKDTTTGSSTTTGGSSTTTGGSSTTTGGSSTTQSGQEYTVTVNTDKVTKQFLKGQEFSYTGLVITDSTGATLEVDGTNVIVDSSSYDKTELGEYEITVVIKRDGKVVSTQKYSVEVVSEIVKEISTVAEFLEMRQYNDESGYNLLTYRLTNDIDLEGVELPDPQANFNGHFDGNGYTIKNGAYTASTSKLGLMFDTVNGEAVVENVKFFNCSVTSAAETCAIIAGEINGVADSNVTIKNVEFNLCTVSTSNNYAGMAIARVESATNATINLENITAKNYCSVSCTQYGGGILGDILTDTKVIAKNCDIDITTSSSGNCSQLVGRNRGGSITAENLIFRGDFTQSNSSIGYVSGGTDKPKNISVKNVLVLGNHLGTGDLVVGNAKENCTIENVYYVTNGGATVKDTYTQVALSDVTASWCTETLKLGDAWEADATTIVKLKSASSNTPSADATVAKLQLSTTNVKKEYFASDAFTTNGISVITVYSDGALSIKQTPSSVKILNSKNQEVTLGADNKFTDVPVGDYTVVITEGEMSASYVIQVVEYSKTSVETGDTNLVYVAGNKLDLSKLYVYSTKTNGGADYIAIKNCTVSVVCGETKVSDGDTLTAVGEYTVTVTANGFSDSFKFTVVEPTQANEAYVKTVVDGSQTASQVWTAAAEAEATSAYEGYYTFNTIEKAVNYLTNLGLSKDAVKVIEVKSGTYREKVTVSIPNVTIVGSGEANTTLVWNTAEGSSTLDGSGVYKMNCATLIATKDAQGFNLSNISVINDFDYENSSIADKQAFAFQSDADKTVVKNVTFSSVQDTLYANAGRQYYYKCTIKGAVDYVFGEGNVTAYFDECTFNTVARMSNGVPSTNTGYVFAPKSEVSETKLAYNYVVVNSTFTADENVPDSSISVARPWGAKGGVAVLDSTFTKHYSKDAYTGSGKPRYDVMSGNKPTDANFYEYNNSGEGSISEAVAGVTFLTEEEAVKYRDVSIVLAEKNGAITYEGGEFAPKTDAQVKTFVKWELGAESYDLDKSPTFVESTYEVYDLQYNSSTGALSTYKQATVEEKFYNAEGTEVTKDDIIATVGTYTVKLMYGETVLGTKEIISAHGPVKTTMNWTYGGEEWTVVGPGTSAVTGYTADSKYNSGSIKVTYIEGSKTTSYVESKEFASATKAIVSIVAGTGASASATGPQIYKLAALDANGNEVATVNITIDKCGDGTNKLLVQSNDVTLTSTTAFVKLRIYAISGNAKTGQKHVVTQINTTLSK